MCLKDNQRGGITINTYENELHYKIIHSICYKDKKESPLLHLHMNNIELVYIKKGHIDCFINEKKFECKENDIFIANIGEMHATQGHIGAEIFILQISAQILTSFNDTIKYNIQNHITSEQMKSVKIYGDVYSMIERINKYDKYSFETLSDSQSSIHDKNIIILSSLTLINMLNKFFPSDGCIKNNDVSNTNTGNFYKIINYINENLTKPITLVTLAKELNYTKGYTSQIFRKYYGTSFKKYLISCRLEKASQDLLRSNKSIADISTECGFNSPRAFYKQFVNSYGMSPSKYRINKKY